MPQLPDNTTPTALVPLGLRRAAAFTWRALLVVAGGVLVVYALVLTQAVVLPVIAALLLTAFVYPATRRLRRRLPDWAVAIVALLALAIVFVGVGFLVIPEVIGQISQVNLNLNQGLRRIEAFILRTFPVSESQVEQGISDAFRTLQSSIGNLASQVVGAAGAAAGLVVQAFVALFLLFFFVKDGPRFYRWLRAAAPEGLRPVVEDLLPQVWSTLQRYFTGVVIVGTIDAVFIALALLIIGVPLVLPLAVLTFFGAFFPLVGAIVAGTVAALVALVSGGLTDALLVVAATVLVQQVEGNVLQPLVMGRQVELHPAVTLLSVTGGGALAGIVGAFLAVPTAAVTRRVMLYASPHLDGAAQAPSEEPVRKKVARVGLEGTEEAEPPEG